MRLLGALPVALVLAACGADEAIEAPGGSSPAITHDDARQCVVGDVSIVEDLAAVPPGFDHSPGQLLDAVTGLFAGDVVLAAQPQGLVAERDAPGWFEVDDHVVEIRLVTAVWSGTDEVCGAWYELPFAAALDSGDGMLAEVFTAQMIVTAGGEPSFELAIPARQLLGTLRPDGDPDRTALVVQGQFTWPSADPGAGAAAWIGELTWREDEGTSASESDVGDFWFSEQ